MENLEELKKSIQNCKKCKLYEERTNIVFGEGNPNADVMFIGDIPDAEEDKKGELFHGKASQLMSKAFLGLGIKKDNVYIANIVKCRPQQNTDPLKEDITECMGYLKKQIILVKPKIIVLLGNISLKNILGENYTITNDRGKWQQIEDIRYMTTWHPTALLRDDNKKIQFWMDLKNVKKIADMKNYKI